MSIPPNSARRLHRNIGYAMVGNVSFNVCRFLVFVLIARTGSVELVGAFSAAMAWSAPIINFSMLQLRAAYVADAKGEFSFGTYVALRRLGMAFAVVGFIALLIWRGGRDPDAARFLPLLAAVCFSKLTWAIGEVYWGVYQRSERLDLMAAANAARGLLMLAPFVIAMPLLTWLNAHENTLFNWTTIACVAYALGWLGYALLIDRRWAHGLMELSQAWNWSGIVSLARHTAPLGIVILIVTACESVPQMVLDDLGEGAKADLGHYSTMVIFILPINLLIISMGQGAANRIAEAYHESVARYWKLVAGLIGTTTLVGLGVFGVTWLMGDWVLRTIYGEQYVAYAHVFPIIGLGGGLLLLASIFGLILTATRAFLMQVPLQLAVLAVTIAAAWVWIPADPVNGAAWTFVARSGTHAVLYGLLLLMLSLRAGQRHKMPAQPKDDTEI